MRLLLAAVLALASCAARTPPPAHGQARHAGEAAMIAADEAFSAASVSRDAPAFAKLVASDAVFFTARGVREGRDAVVEGWRPFLTPGGPTLRWSPHRAEASAEGDLGFTVGRWELADGAEVATGEYVTVWRRTAGGGFEAVLDGTYVDASAGPEAAPVSAIREVRSRAGDLGAALARIEGPGGPALSLTVIRAARDGRNERRLESRVPLAAAAR